MSEDINSQQEMGARSGSSLDADTIANKIRQDMMSAASSAHSKVDQAADKLESGASTVADKAKEEAQTRTSSDTATEVSSGAAQAEQVAVQAVQAAQQQAHKAVDQATQQAGQMIDAVQQQASSLVSNQLGYASSQVSSVARALSAAGKELRNEEQGTLAQVTDQAATQLENISNYLSNGDINGIIYDVEDFARREPALFVGGALAAGILLARFFKSSQPSAPQRGSYRSQGTTRAYEAQQDAYERRMSDRYRYGSSGRPGYQGGFEESRTASQGYTTSDQANSPYGRGPRGEER